MTVPIGYANVIVPLKNSSLSRSAAITFGVADGASIGNATSIATAVQTVLDGDFLDRLDSNVTMGPVQAYLGASGGTTPGTTTGTSTGQLSINSPPPNVAVLVHKATATGGRKGRGRLFLPWYIDKGSIDEAGNLDTTQRLNINNALTNMLSDLSSADVPMVVLHGDSTMPSVVLTLDVDGRAATQRDRLGR